MSVFTPLLIALVFIAPSDVKQQSHQDKANVDSASARASADIPEGAALSGASTSALLETSVNSKGTKAGKEIKATLRQVTLLPSGELLPRGTILLGTVEQVSTKSKEKPNGALLLKFDRAQRKDGTVLPLAVKIESLAPATANMTTVPGARLGGTSNMGGTQQMAADQVSGHTIVPSHDQISTIEGVSLGKSATGSAVAYAMKGDVYLDSGIVLGLRVKASSAGTPRDDTSVPAVH